MFHLGRRSRHVETVPEILKRVQTGFTGLLQTYHWFKDRSAFLLGRLLFFGLGDGGGSLGLGFFFGGHGDGSVVLLCVAACLVFGENL
jgi:hypothetical protein